MSGNTTHDAHGNTAISNEYSMRVQSEISRGSNVSAVSLLATIIDQAYATKASDIHIDPTEDIIIIRLRIDGELQIVHVLPKSIHALLLSRLKILCGLRTDEHQAAQDGRLQHVCSDNATIDVRVSIMPLYYGENAVLRLLVASHQDHSLKSLGFTEANQAKILAAMKKPYGMILATGPTGSGKTTTLYTLLSLQDATKTAIVTIEDPIEYAIKGVNQIQVNPRTGLTFAQGLRSILRQDPNTIMVGEIRDGETAGLAVNIALTGHVVVSTLHTNDAATTLPRLLDMKIEPYLIASTVNVAIGQRLVRRLCHVCKIEKKLSVAAAIDVSQYLAPQTVSPGISVWCSVGCDACNHSGYSGRVGVYEVLVLTSTIREAVLRRASAESLRSLAIKEGMVPLIHDGLQKAFAGITTIEEVLKMHYE